MLSNMQGLSDIKILSDVNVIGLHKETLYCQIQANSDLKKTYVILKYKISGSYKLHVWNFKFV